MTDSPRVNTVWMWQDAETTWGVNLEVEDGLLIWQEGLAAFGCITTPAGQPVADFMANGPHRYACPPLDVVEEIRASITALDLMDVSPADQNPKDVL
jgi:hypothetical protein